MIGANGEKTKGFSSNVTSTQKLFPLLTFSLSLNLTHPQTHPHTLPSPPRTHAHSHPQTLYLLSLSGSPPLAKEEIQFNFKCDKNATDALQKKLQNEKSDPKLNGPQEIWGLISKHLFRKQRQLRRLLQNSDPFENLFRVKKFWFIGLL